MLDIRLGNGDGETEVKAIGTAFVQMRTVTAFSMQFKVLAQFLLWICIMSFNIRGRCNVQFFLDS
jgi:hypothetical protein